MSTATVCSETVFTGVREVDLSWCGLGQWLDCSVSLEKESKRSHTRVFMHVLLSDKPSHMPHHGWTNH